MAQISKMELDAEVARYIERQLLLVLFKSRSRESMSIFSDLLTDTERLMFAKRMAAVLMLIDEQSYYRIEQVLGMSTSTSKRLHSLLSTGVFSNLEGVMKKKQAHSEILVTIGKLLRAGLPPRTYVIKKRIRRAGPG